MNSNKSRDLGLAGMRLAGGFAMVCLLGLTACGSKDKAAGGQSLARVDGQEITVLQLNAELAQANVPAQQRNAASKKILDSLIDRQLLQEQAAHDKLDRDPAVVVAIERAKAQIIAQAYLQRRLAKVARPTAEEVSKYYMDHPDFFAGRKVYDFDQVVLASKDFGADLKAILNANKSLDDVAAWAREHHVAYAQSIATNNSVDLPPALVQRLKDMRKGQSFAVQEGDKTVIAALKNVRAVPVSSDVANPQIAVFLQNQRNKEAAEAEMARLRAAAKIEYLNKNLADAGKTATPAADSGAVQNKQDGTTDHVKRGVADL